MSTKKQGLRVIDAETFNSDEERYELRIDDPLAPLCPYGNRRTFIGFDKKSNEFVRFTKSILIRLLKN